MPLPPRLASLRAAAATTFDLAAYFTLLMKKTRSIPLHSGCLYDFTSCSNQLSRYDCRLPYICITLAGRKRLLHSPVILSDHFEPHFFVSFSFISVTLGANFQTAQGFWSRLTS